MWLSIQDQMLIDRYLRDPHDFARLVEKCRALARWGACKNAPANDAIDLLEGLFRLAQARQEELAKDKGDCQQELNRIGDEFVEGWNDEQARTIT